MFCAGFKPEGITGRASFRDLDFHVNDALQLAKPQGVLELQ